MVYFLQSTMVGMSLNPAGGILMQSSEAERYFKRAEEARRNAEAMAEEASKQMMLRIAREYEDFVQLRATDNPDGSPMAV